MTVKNMISFIDTYENSIFVFYDNSGERISGMLRYDLEEDKDYFERYFDVTVSRISAKDYGIGCPVIELYINSGYCLPFKEVNT